MLGSRLPRHKKFDYEPLYWKPEKEEQAPHKIKFKRTYRRRAAKQRSLLWLIVLLAFVIYFLHFLTRLGR
jgi:hypothetical protein